MFKLCSYVRARARVCVCVCVFACACVCVCSKSRVGQIDSDVHHRIKVIVPVPIKNTVGVRCCIFAIGVVVACRKCIGTLLVIPPAAVQSFHTPKGIPAVQSIESHATVVGEVVRQVTMETTEVSEVVGIVMKKKLVVDMFYIVVPVLHLDPHIIVS